MRLTCGVIIVTAALVVGCRSRGVRTAADGRWRSVDPGPAGKPAAGFTTALTGGGGPTKWVVRRDATTRATATIVQESADDTSYRFPLCIYDGVTATDVDAEVAFKAIAGTVDQAAGLVLRYAPENYYVARANPLEDNVNLFKTVNGQRMKLAEVGLKVPANEWHTLGFSARGDRLVVTVDGKTLIDATDPTFAGPGKVGLWTKADSVTAFADLRVRAVR